MSPCRPCSPHTQTWLCKARMCGCSQTRSHIPTHAHMSALNTFLSSTSLPYRSANISYQPMAPSWCTDFSVSEAFMLDSLNISWTKPFLSSRLNCHHSWPRLLPSLQISPPLFLLLLWPQFLHTQQCACKDMSQSCHLPPCLKLRLR